MSGGTIRRRLLVSGRVQGVFFRDSCRRQAQVLGVLGSADNLADGRVEVVLEGEREPVEAMVQWCHSGSQYAQVTSVEVSEEEPSGLDGFTIL